MREKEGPRVFVVTSEDIARCPIQSLKPEHYRDDGTCRCDEEPPFPEEEDQ